MRWPIYLGAGILLAGMFVRANDGFVQNPPKTADDACLTFIDESVCNAARVARDVQNGRDTATFSQANDPILPNRQTTPGTINPAITQENIARTICQPSVAASYEPTIAFQGQMKRQLLRQQYPGRSHADFALDFVVPPMLGGSANDPRNIWLQPYFAQPNVKDKDRLELILLQRVCAGEIALADAQRALATNWIGAYAAIIAGPTGQALAGVPAPEVTNNFAHSRPVEALPEGAVAGQPAIPDIAAIVAENTGNSDVPDDRLDLSRPVRGQ